MWQTLALEVGKHNTWKRYVYCVADPDFRSEEAQDMTIHMEKGKHLLCGGVMHNTDFRSRDTQHLERNMFIVWRNLTLEVGMHKTRPDFRSGGNTRLKTWHDTEAAQDLSIIGDYCAQDLYITGDYCSWLHPLPSQPWIPSLSLKKERDMNVRVVRLCSLATSYVRGS